MKHFNHTYIYSIFNRIFAAVRHKHSNQELKYERINIRTALKTLV